MQIISNIFHFAIGFILGLFVYSQIILPIIYSLPKSIIGVIKGKLKAKIIFIHISSPIIWLIIINIIYFISQWILPGVYRLITNQNFITGWSLSFFFIIAGFFIKTNREDIRKEYEDFVVEYKN